MGIDHLPPGDIAMNVREHALGVIAAGSEAWLDALGSALPFVRDTTTERYLQLFAGTTCCAQHRTIRVYTSCPVSLSMEPDKDTLAKWLPEFDVWKTSTVQSAAATIVPLIKGTYVCS